jgi:hypothetical protein
MNTNTSIYAHIENSDNLSRAALLTGLGNWALGQLAWNTQRYVRDLASTHEVDPSMGQDAMTMAEEAIKDDPRDPPVGLERIETVQEKQKRFGVLYAKCMDECLRIGADEYNRPQSINDRVDWLASQSGTALQQARDAKARGDLTRALRIANAANVEARFWQANTQTVKDEMHFHTAAINTDEDAFDLDDQIASPVEAMNAVAAMYKAVLARLNNRKGNRFFEASGPLGDIIRSEAGVLEAELGGLRLLSAAIERANTTELLEAINRGVNIRLLDDMDRIAAHQLNEKLERELAKLGVV